jgi:cellulose synthase/poly-beta-1,6-N-acetylglucosamine synthase-like glycosyltransferase
MNADASATTGDTRGISVVLPAYNEERQIYQMVTETRAAMGETGMPFEIVVVDDGSTDGTAREAMRASLDFEGVRAIILPENQGKGNALNRGFQASTRDLVCFIDADLDLHPRQVRTLLEVMRSSGADVVIGSKRHPESKLDYPWYRKLFSTVYYLLTLLLFRLPVKDTQTGIKLFRREVLARSFPRIVCKQYTLDVELLVVANRLGYRIAEAPITLTFQGRFGRVGWPSIRNIITDTMAVFYRLNILKYYKSPMLPTVNEEPRVAIVMAAPELDTMFERFHERCRELNYGNFEIVVVTDRPVENDTGDPLLRFVSGGQSGPAAKKNVAAATSTDAEILAFIDQDAIPDIDWLRNAVPYFDDESVGAVCGPALTPASGSRRQIAGGLVFSSSMVSGTTNYRFTRHAMREVDDYPSFNFIVRRSDFMEAGGYPEEFVAGEDTVLCLRLTRDLGKKILYVPNVLLYQHRGPLFVPHLKNVYSYASTRGSFVRRYPETSRRLRYFIPSALLVSLASGLVLSLVSRIARCVYLPVVGIYGAAAALASVKTLDIRTNLLIFPGIVATNLTYGYGFLRGLMKRDGGAAGVG